MDEKRVTFSFGLPVLQVIFQGLGKLPYEQVGELISAMEAEAKKQIEAANQPADKPTKAPTFAYDETAMGQD